MLYLKRGGRLHNTSLKGAQDQPHIPINGHSDEVHRQWVPIGGGHGLSVSFKET